VIRPLVLVVNLLVVLVGLGLAVAHKERTLRDGTVVFLRLAPVDPRSLLQGDYMRLAYAIDAAVNTSRQDPRGATPDLPRDGLLVVRREPSGEATFVRLDREAHDRASPLAPGELRLRYRVRDGWMRVGTDAFYFEEGQADRFESAVFGELRVDAAGESVLVNMRDQAMVPLGPGLR
jgi:uncharacterized membrane-anchored protein